jgi:hypothetical protein
MADSQEVSDGSRTLTVGASVHVFLDEHPEFAHKPGEIVKALGVKIGSAKREAKEWRDSKTLTDLGPVLLQNIRIQGRTTPGTSPSGSPQLLALGTWETQGDGKEVVSVPIPPDARATVYLSANGALELYLAAPRGLTPAEVQTILALLRLPWDREAAPTFSMEMLRDGRTLRFEGIECRTYEDVEGHLVKLYNHTDERGTMGRVEVRSPPVKASWPEIEAFLEARQPLGRDTQIERLTDMVEDVSRAVVQQGKEIMHMRRAMDELRGAK